MALAGLFMAATAANTRPAGAWAFAARTIVMLAVALVASEALRQVQQPAQAAPAAGTGGDGGMASLLSLVSGAEGKASACENPAAAAGEGDGVAGNVACLKVSRSVIPRGRHLPLGELLWSALGLNVLYEGGLWPRGMRLLECKLVVFSFVLCFAFFLVAVRRAKFFRGPGWQGDSFA